MKLYRIYTEHKNLDSVVHQANQRFEGFTVLSGVGYWKGKAEPALIIEVVAPEEDRELVVDLALSIKRTNAQEAVLLTTQSLAVDFL